MQRLLLTVIGMLALGTSACAMDAGADGVDAGLGVAAAESERCVEAREGRSVTLACPDGSRIARIDFASYGRPNGSCDDGLSAGACHAASSVHEVEARCAGKGSCTVAASNTVFGDPCKGKRKRLAVTYTCGGGDEDPGVGDGPVGFAAENGGTSGGQGGKTVTVSTKSDFLDAIADDRRMTVRVKGKISLSSMHPVASNKTIVGVGSSGVISGGGLEIIDVSNVIVRNLRFERSVDDAINIASSRNVWIDHCDFTDAHDGLVDIKRGADFVTVSWNRFTNHKKTCLLGHDDSNGKQDRGHLRVTYHHNWFDGTSGRHPRVRFSALTHVYNNYYLDNDYGVASTTEAEVLVEGNYFDNVDGPTYAGYGDSEPGDLEERKNIFKRSGSPETRRSVPEPPYAYELDDAADVPAIVRQRAGRAGFGR